VAKYKYDTLDNLPGEVLTDIRALANHFRIALPNINKAILKELQNEKQIKMQI
jgi:hypothetical protein